MTTLSHASLLSQIKKRQDDERNALVKPDDVLKVLTTFGIDVSKDVCKQTGGSFDTDFLKRISNFFFCKSKSAPASLPELPFEIMVKILENNGSNEVKPYAIMSTLDKRFGKLAKGRSDINDGFFAMHFVNSIVDIMMHEIKSVQGTQLENGIDICIYKNLLIPNNRTFTINYLTITIETFYSPTYATIQRVCFSYRRSPIYTTIDNEQDAYKTCNDEIREMLPQGTQSQFHFANVWKMGGGKERERVDALKMEFIKFLKETVRVPSFFKLTRDICNKQIDVESNYRCKSVLCKLKMYFLKKLVISQQLKVISDAMGKVYKYTQNVGLKVPLVPATPRPSGPSISEPMRVDGVGLVHPPITIRAEIAFTEDEMKEVKRIMLLYKDDAFFGDDYRFDLVPSDPDDYRKIDDIYDKLQRNGYMRDKKQTVEAAAMSLRGNLLTFINNFANNTVVYNMVKETLKSWQSKEIGAPIIKPIRKYLKSKQIQIVKTYLDLVNARRLTNTLVVYSEDFKNALVKIAYFDEGEAADDADVEDDEDIYEMNLVYDEFFFKDPNEFIKRLYRRIDEDDGGDDDNGVLSSVDKMINEMKIATDILNGIVEEQAQEAGRAKHSKHSKHSKRKYTKSSQTIMYKKKMRTVYTGVRGGRYVKMGQEYKSVR
jgi:hypothetical protein